MAALKIADFLDPRARHVHQAFHSKKLATASSTGAAICAGLCISQTIPGGKGSLSLPKRMNFRKISERPLPPPPAPFSENFIAIFSANRLRRH